MRHALLSTLVVLFLGACGPVSPPGELAVSRAQRITTAAPAADVEAVVDGNTDFGLSVYREVRQSGGNVAFSPHSVATALAMTYPGARGDTQTAFEKVLHVSVPQAQWHRAMNTLERALASRGVGASGRDGKGFRLMVNNQVFAQQGYALLGDYLDLLAAEYGAGVRLLDFVTDAEAARKAINGWVATNTAGLIPELLAQGVIDADTRLTLVNTLYFNAAWKKAFKKESTFTGDFTVLDGAKKSVSMMSGEGIALGHAVVDGIDVVALPYSGDEVSLLLLMPPTSKFTELETALTAARVRSFATAAAQNEVTTSVHMPKFEVRTQARLGEVLTKLGLGVAFGGDADFSGMTGTRELSIGAVIHEAVVKTDESGTEAAAATAVVMTRGASVPQFLEIDRPFVYLVRDNATGTVLFMGRVVDP